MRVVFVHGALVFDGAWWWHRMAKPLAALGLSTRAVELPSCVAPPVPSVEAMGDMHADVDAVRAAGERLDVQRLRVLPVDPVANAAQERSEPRSGHIRRAKWTEKPLLGGP